MFKWVLESAGFEVIALSGRVIWNQPIDAVTRRSHMILLVKVDGKEYLTDVGFGGNTPTGPLLFEARKEQKTPHEYYRIIQEEAPYYRLEIKIKEDWKAMYRFTLEEQFLIDYEMANFFVSKYPASSFVTGLSAFRAGPRSRFNLKNNRFSVHYSEGTTEHTELKTLKALKDTLQDVFHLELPQVSNLDSALKKLLH